MGTWPGALFAYEEAHVSPLEAPSRSGHRGDPMPAERISRSGARMKLLACGSTGSARDPQAAFESPVPLTRVSSPSRHVPYPPGNLKYTLLPSAYPGATSDHPHGYKYDCTRATPTRATRRCNNSRVGTRWPRGKKEGGRNHIRNRAGSGPSNRYMYVL